mmetsp:Transcript_16745/g.35951  ORF Transcript_16745/g.35951 Transcript_16745/m.35951 type:complete len:215 (-) Transcript_16745:384-1028(-)
MLHESIGLVPSSPCLIPKSSKMRTSVASSGASLPSVQASRCLKPKSVTAARDSSIPAGEAAARSPARYAIGVPSTSASMRASAMPSSVSLSPRPFESPTMSCCTPTSASSHAASWIITGPAAKPSRNVARTGSPRLTAALAMATADSLPFTRLSSHGNSSKTPQPFGSVVTSSGCVTRTYPVPGESQCACSPLATTADGTLSNESWLQSARDRS